MSTDKTKPTGLPGLGGGLDDDADTDALIAGLKASKPASRVDPATSAALADLSEHSSLINTSHKPRKVSKVKLPAHPAEKVVRDGYSMPPDDYDLLEAQRKRAMRRERDVTKSGLLRIGVHLLAKLSDDDLMSLIDGLVEPKPGRRAGG